MNNTISTKYCVEEVISKKIIKYYEYDNFNNIEEIGIGNFGRVFRANYKNSQHYLALKSFFNFNEFTLEKIVHLKTGACCTEEPIPANIEAIIKDIHPKVISRYYGCGSPFPPALEGKTVLDLGSGSGRDFIFLIIRIDLDMVIFKKGYIEDLQSIGIEDESIDVVVSNGSRIPESLVKDPILYGECLSGALYIEDFRRLITSLGYPDYRTIINRKVDIEDSDIKQKIGMIDFYSITIRTFKVPLEDRSEDYGQVAVYKGNIEDKFVLDNHHVFKINDQVPICGNTSAMLQKTRYADYFDIIGESVHYGLFKSSG
ncbi:hypothetical protein RhiirA5_424497 [Rhizophagus irregularis]|uniref:Protein kinase domain-containing protein n=3 Tax=Rhizophagus irregularis TaxID=588596 RepID=A0A2N0P7Y6_9GLOM|nr:hypothetical protein RhiirA5_424497 [Rhizophagus irregularis]